MSASLQPTAEYVEISNAQSQRRDPTRTTDLRRSFKAELNRRIVKFSKHIREAVEVGDYFALRGPNALSSLTAGSPDACLQAFGSWLVAATRSSFGDGQWMRTYIQRAYARGISHAEARLRERVKIDSRAYATQFYQAQQDLNAILTTASQYGVRVASVGLARRSRPQDLSKSIRQAVEKIVRDRGSMLVTTHVVASHAEATLDAAESVGITHVRRIPEWNPSKVVRDTRPRYVRWLTAGDDRVCFVCAAREGDILKISEARRSIPVHPNCRCAWELLSKSELIEFGFGEG